MVNKLRGIPSIYRYTIIGIFSMCLIVYALYWYVKIRPANSVKREVNAMITELSEGNCDANTIKDLQENYTVLSDKVSRAKTAGTVVHCLSVSGDNIPEAIEWSRNAEEAYRSIGDNDSADRYEAYLSLFSTTKAEPDQQTDVTNKDLGTD